MIDKNQPDNIKIAFLFATGFTFFLTLYSFLCNSSKEEKTDISGIDYLNK
jgi:hypothetical protein